jgi:hypothetical protein
LTPHPAKCSPDSAEGFAPEAGAPENKAVALAQRLYETMQRLDPPSDPSAPLLAWDDITDRERQFYVLCVEDLLDEIG